MLEGEEDFGEYWWDNEQEAEVNFVFLASSKQEVKN